MILGIGIDIIEIERVKRMISRYGEKFLTRIFTESEISYCENKAYPEIHFSARFSAKEAFLKALGTGLSGGIRWRDVETVNDDDGKPDIRYSGKAEEYARKNGVIKVHLSISHSRDYSFAMVALEGKDITDR